ncbi:hypothetical protein UFOVP1619_35 [uncultured Caudovirales phage]|uniref:Uncharacterized protein n=1 Tax=uncultured Caudovirales phage TaxID=2100421 RepID=A0A6J5SXJ0_9CAUD|nr:hypothetical protein UFOVP1619_35 [uncultured Caudovirales phage]
MNNATKIQNSVDAAGLRAEYEDMEEAAKNSGIPPKAFARIFTKTMIRFWLEDPKKQALNLSVSMAAITHLFGGKPKKQAPPDGQGINARIAEAWRRRCLQNIEGTPVD